MTHDTETLNATVRYTMWTVFALEEVLPEDDDERAELITAAQAAVAADGLVVRGWYDVAGLRADADLMVWWHAETVEEVQGAYQRLRASDLGRHLLPVWSVVGLHRPAEFNRGHVPAFLAGEPAGDYLCVYPFVRSYDWYVLPEDDRRRMLVEHGQAARDYPDVRANTVSAFALGDYEWILAFEAPELHRIVDLMRDLRATDARLHVREEVPFYTGPRVTLETWADRQPRG
ncbi:hydrogen peroxide-dependent heme synthase [Cellulomonas fengjieae]|uniref:Coproheme decarboxylase n=1 Tax=Cellulomonas fengjieae TaxID=2819978 RepID=A0ABS3SDG6_9CELL|nr:hydrogen peroxide-dependent heme synthase [Cellulomonas fengjieae]MBO3083801.1 chlorite dismutase family protein [Cellulomonas fengjieae]MBO3101450.1 chlorite dismutase family protein [Cellulomonas fengjieae]QVI64910.1 chlorite dismutase family protein [Cellulomonas fengjieae]